MDKAATLQLYHRGREAWNAWARDLLQQRPGDDLVLEQEWESKADVDLSHENFGEDADFRAFEFPGHVDFRGATFQAAADFSDATFHGVSYFDRSVFVGNATFDGAVFHSAGLFTEVTFHGVAQFNSASFGGITDFQKTVFKENAEFGSRSLWHTGRFFDAINRPEFRGTSFGDTTTFLDAVFEKRASFSAQFESSAQFSGSTFGGGASFDGAFGGHTVFKRTAFKSSVEFRSTFKGGTTFEEAAFGGYSSFRDVEFREDVSFRGSDFDDVAIFEGSKYRADADFTAVRAARFSMGNAIFSCVPTFTVATFAAPPRMDISVDDSRIRDKLRTFMAVFREGDPRKNDALDIVNLARAEEGKPRIRKRRFHIRDAVGTIINHDVDLESRWRVLRRLASQDYDHERERRFLREELIARRWVTDKPWRAFFWVGILYQVLSDFGRSLSRPLVFWVLVWFGFGLLYFELANEQNHCAGMRQYYAAFSLSLQRNFAALSNLIGFGSLQEQHLMCLYGARKGDATVLYLGVVQLVLSSALIFLALFAVRNRFRLR